MWKKLVVVFNLKTPLHIGYLSDKGSVIARTRYYVPGKNFWGAVTKRTTENLFDFPLAQNYLEVGNQIKTNFRFGYFYLYDGEIKYIPEFTEDGLKYEKVNAFKFERKFIGSRVSTAIDGMNGTAKDESLHEIEFISNKYREVTGTIRCTQLIGCIWIQDGTVLPTKDGKKKIEVTEYGIFIDGFNLIKRLKLGGEQNYGFGLVEFDSFKREFPIDSEINTDKEVRIHIKKGSALCFPLSYDKNISFQGDLELISGREYQTKSELLKNPGRYSVPPEYYFSPGTKIFSDDKKTATMAWNGTLRLE